MPACGTSNRPEIQRCDELSPRHGRPVPAIHVCIFHAAPKTWMPGSSRACTHKSRMPIGLAMSALPFGSGHLDERSACPLWAIGDIYAWQHPVKACLALPSDPSYSVLWVGLPA